ncbi:MAG: hypothetical protein HFJ17_01450 [Clostridia bacterium]|nr:hypothetical protein [Clostridia bacterium]
MKVIKKIISILIIVTLIDFSSIMNTLPKVQAGETVQLSLTTQPNIDVVLSKAKTSMDLTNFTEDLYQALATQGIKRERVNISNIEAEKVDLTEEFNWNEDISSSIGSISITNNGQNVEMKGNQTNPGKNAIWIIPDKDLEQNFTFNYDIEYGDSFKAAGMLLRVKQDGNILTGYMLSFNNNDPQYNQTKAKEWYTLAGNKLRSYLGVYLYYWCKQCCND